MANAEIAYAFGEKVDNFHGEMGVGLFPFKYNPEARNLGEYLFSRTGTYPGFINTTFDWTASRLTGLRFSSELFNFWKNDLILSTEMELYPFYDLTFSWVTDLPLGKILDLGGGISFCRFLPANPGLTTPEYSANHPGNKAEYNYYLDGGDTVYYTFKGIKTMGRATLDPKAILGLVPGEGLLSWGKEDGKIFGEAAILGLANQGPVYNNILQRMPIMFGCNIPTFNLFDVLAFQSEWYGSPYPNSDENQIEFVSEGLPLPTKGKGYASSKSPYTVADTTNGRPNFYTKDNWKWSIYGRRWIGKHIAIVAQAARDHWRATTPFSGKRDYEEALSTPKHWYWALKIVSVW
jgi:hypothetical protein